MEKKFVVENTQCKSSLINIALHMEKLTEKAKAEIWAAKKSWNEQNKDRQLFRATSMQQVQKCASESYCHNQFKKL